MLEVIRQDFIRTAQRQGPIRDGWSCFSHALKGRAAAGGELHGAGGRRDADGLGGGRGGVFGIPGVGREFVRSALNRDYNVVLGTVILYSSMLVFLNMAVDVIYTWLDPRVSYDK